MNRLTGYEAPTRTDQKTNQIGHVLRDALSAQRYSLCPRRDRFLAQSRVGPTRIVGAYHHLIGGDAVFGEV